MSQRREKWTRPKQASDRDETRYKASLTERAYALLGGLVGGMGFMCGVALRWRYRNERPKGKRNG